MPFNYYETYRTESPDAPELEYMTLRGASSLAEGRWVFFDSDRDPYKVSMPAFKVVSSVDKDDGVIEAKVDGGDPKNPFLVRFIPLTVEFMREHPDRFNLSESALRQLGDLGMKELLLTGLIPEWYVEQFGPPEEIEEDDSGS